MEKGVTLALAQLGREPVGLWGPWHTPRSQVPVSRGTRFRIRALAVQYLCVGQAPHGTGCTRWLHPHQSRAPAPQR